MNSISEACSNLKQSYDKCFNSWYSEKFLKGEKSTSDCDALFKEYQACVKAALKEKNLLTSFEPGFEAAAMANAGSSSNASDPAR
ncbi:hypothetical protein CAOG_009464 [Capsaspora owczarzaki ATCC 30864]|uniref:TP53 regulated inhibitor of apoptosis 1 n=1 Tax=Capsaspora owczarzaki (strain ATCC 30864) TaxID=595528 RepID=A0A0D2WL36_CAPO3|nr:hypothetical protein CAOG_009464 [Capsaspora owczarzaki ATCC 30864]